MAKIDIDLWKPFKVGDIFETEFKNSAMQVPTGGWIASKRFEEGSTPRITVSGVNNGVVGYYADVDDANYRVYENFISVSFLGTVFYQATRASLDMKVHCLKPIGIELNERIAGFLVTLIRQALGRVEYSDQISSKVLPDLEITLPVDSSNAPDWEYMNTFMAKVICQAQNAMDVFKSVRPEAKPMDSSNWRKFQIGDLFRIEKGTRLTRVNMLPGDTPFIGATLESNGITARIGNTGHIHPGGVITVAYNGQKATGKAFYQPEPFWASDDVNVLYPKFELTEEIALFLIPLFWEAGKPYAFDDKWGKDVMEKTEIPLPAIDSQTPDWSRISEMSSSWCRDVQHTLQALSSIEMEA